VDVNTLSSCNDEHSPPDEVKLEGGKLYFKNDDGYEDDGLTRQ
jgi:hypothetical protein